MAQGSEKAHNSEIAFEATLVTAQHGVDDYDITGHPVVHWACIGYGIKPGEMDANRFFG